MTRNDARRSGGQEQRILTTFRWVPEPVRGLVRDVRVRWALEEAGLSYSEHLIGFEDQDTAQYRHLQPFGQVPVYRDGELELFESGAIVLHIASQSAALMPHDEAGRLRTLTWMFAALNTVEPPVAMLVELDFFSAGEAWARERRPALVERALKRLGELDRELEGRDYFAGQFTVADILMTTVLRYLRNTDFVSRFPAVDAYFKRCNARPAAIKALADHMAVFDAPVEA
jgi:glutathione S-transferase